MSTKKLPKVGKILNTSLLLTIAYITYTVMYYIKSQMYFDGLLRMPDQPLLLYGIKWFYGILLLVGIIRLNSKAKTAYLLINSASVAIVLLWLLTTVYLVFYISNIDRFLMVLIAVVLLLSTNLGDFLRQHNIKRKLSDLLYVFVIPIIVTVGLYYLVPFFDK